MSGWRDQPRRAYRIHSLRGSRDLVVRGLRPNHNEIVRALVHLGQDRSVCLVWVRPIFCVSGVIILIG
jgi:hypothetical protein